MMNKAAKRVTTITAITLLTMTAGLSASAQAPSDHQQKQSRQHNPEMRQKMLDEFDANKDGKLDETERKALRETMHARMIERFDANGNGVLDENERPNIRHQRGPQRDRFNSRRGRGSKRDFGPRHHRGERDQLNQPLGLMPEDAEFDRPASKGQGCSNCSKGPEGQNRHSRKGRRDSDRPSREAMLKRFDADGDGKLNDAERENARAEMQKRREQMRAEMLQRFDIDEDGTLNDAERKAMHEARKAEMKKRQAQMKTLHEQILEQFDADGDGKLLGEEREAARQTMREKMQSLRQTRQMDLNRDGKVDSVDVAKAMDLIKAQDPRADFNHDRIVDEQDAAAIVKRASQD